MPRELRPKDLFKSIKPGHGERGPWPGRRKEAALRAEPAEDRIVSDRDGMMTISLTIERELFEKYNAGKSRGRYGAAMREQLWKKFR